MSKAKLFSGAGPVVKSAIRRTIESAARVLLLIGLLGVGTGVCRAQTNITEYAIPSNVSIGPYGIACGADGAYWFTEFFLPNSTGLIGRYDAVSNAFTQFVLLTNHDAYGVLYAEPYGICPGPAGDPNLWFTEYYAAQLGRISTNGIVTEFALTNMISSNTTITLGPDNNLWFVEYNLNRIAAVTPPSPTTTAGTLPLVHEYGPFGTNVPAFGGSPGTNAYLNGLASGPDGNLWFTQYTYGTIGKLNPATGAYTLYTLPSTNCGPWSIVAGLDGALWFSEYASNTIGRITTTGQVTEYPLPLLSGEALPYPYGMLTANDGNIWFTEYEGTAIGRITPTGIITLFPTVTPGSCPFGLATGPDNNIWFTEYVDGFEGIASHNNITKNIGRLLVSQSLNLSLPSANITGTNFTGVLAYFQNSTPINTVTVAWGDGNYSVLTISTLTTIAPSASVTNIVVSGTQRFTNSLTITQLVPIDTNNNNGTFSVSANHTYATFSNYPVTITVTDPRSDTAVGNIGVNYAPVFTGESIVKGALVLSVTGKPGRTYTVQSSSSHSNAKWTSIGSVTLPTNSSTGKFTNTLSSSNLFFRLSYP